MTTISAKFYDGKTSRGTPVSIHLALGDWLRISGLERDRIYGLSEVRISARLGDTSRSISLPDGAVCETFENDMIDAILRRQGRGGWPAVIHTLASKWRYVLLLLLVTLVGVWALIDYGIPALAKRVAFHFPVSVDKALGRDGLKLLDRTLFSPSGLGAKRQEHLRTVFAAMTRDRADGYAYRLEFRKSDRAGANAFALPSGIIVLTDAIVVFAHNQHELIGVLAHEIGHVKHRHALRALLQNSAVALLIASATGDVTSLTALSAALPTLLVRAKYSRAFETEADRFALQYLLDHNIPTTNYADILVRLDKARARDGDAHNYLASHPVTSQRIRTFKEER